MDITRSIGYVQIYFGIFIVLTGLFAGLLAINHSQYNNHGYPVKDANYELLTIEEKILSNQQEMFLLELTIQAELARRQLVTQLLIGMVILIALGVHATLHGIVHTRKGNVEHLHPKKKIIHNMVYAILLSVVFLILIWMITGI